MTGTGPEKPDTRVNNPLLYCGRFFSIDNNNLCVHTRRTTCCCQFEIITRISELPGFQLHLMPLSAKKVKARVAAASSAARRVTGNYLRLPYSGFSGTTDSRGLLQPDQAGSSDSESPDGRLRARPLPGSVAGGEPVAPRPLRP